MTTGHYGPPSLPDATAVSPYPGKTVAAVTVHAIYKLGNFHFLMEASEIINSEGKGKKGPNKISVDIKV